MKVKLISFSKPATEVKLQGIEDAQDLIAYCARVSNPSNQFNTETADKLIKYLIKHQHWSPLEMVSACLEIETTRDIARQLLRHRSFSFQEFSQRYADPTKELSFCIREARLQDEKNRQNSLESSDESLQNWWKAKQESILELVSQTYQEAISKGIAKEQARVILPEGNTVSKLYANGTIRSWIHYIAVRTDGSTQKEHRELALECAKVISKVFPVVSELH